MFTLEGDYLLTSQIRFPENCNKYDPLPLLIALHGFGDNQQNFKRLFEKQNDMIVVIPETPYPFSMGREIGYSWTNMAPVKTDLGKASMLINASNIRSIIEYMKNKYTITHVYILGFSQGAGLAYIAGIKNYDLVDGVASFGGWLDAEYLTRTSLKLAKGLNVYIAHGTNDRVIELKAAESAYDLLKEKEYNVKLATFDGAHQVPPDIQLSALQWLKEQSGK